MRVGKFALFTVLALFNLRTFAAACYGTNVTSGQIENLPADATLTYVASENPVYESVLILKGKSLNLRTRIDCAAAAKTCYLPDSDGQSFQLFGEGDHMKIVSEGPLALTPDESGALQLTIHRRPGSTWVIRHIKAFYGDMAFNGATCTELVKTLDPEKVFEDEQVPSLSADPADPKKPFGDPTIGR